MGGSFKKENIDDYSQNLKNARKVLIGLNKEIEGSDIKLCVENLPTLGHLGNPPYELPIYPKETIYLVNGLKNIGVCFDIGHANTVCEPVEFLNALLNQGISVYNVHLHDNNGTKDEHLPIGQGNINFKRFLEKLKKEGYSDLPLSIELDTWNEYPEPMKKEERLKGLISLKNMLKELSHN